MTKTPLTSSHLFAASTILKQVDVLAENARGAREGGHPDAVHHMRVASRRIRNAINLFESVLPAKRAARWEKRLRRLTNALGRARDLDVKIEFARQFRDALPEGKAGRGLRPGVERLLLRLEQARQRVQRRVVNELDRFEKRQVVTDVRETLRDVKVQAKTLHVRAHDPRIRAEAGPAILRRLEEMLVFQPYVGDPQQTDQHHQMRIAAKTLRYTLETYRPLYEDGLGRQLELAKKVQGDLGAIHDCDVWVEWVPRFLDEEGRRFDQFYGHRRGFRRIQRGVEHLHDDRARRRDELLREFADWWQARMRSETWEKFRELFDRPVHVVGIAHPPGLSVESESVNRAS